MLIFINTIPELNRDKNHLVASMTNLNYENIDLVKLNSEIKEKKYVIEKTHQLDSCNLSLKSENLKLSVIAKEKDKECDQPLR